MSQTSTSSVAASNHVAPVDRLATLQRFPLDGSIRTLGFEAVMWAESNLVQPNGPLVGQPFRFTPDQVEFLLWWYSVDGEGRWLYSHGARRLAKGSGKSPFAAVLALIEFLAPVRFERFDDRALGGCVGKQVAMPWVQIAATAESQTANTMRMVRAFCPKGGDLADRYGIDVGKQRFYRAPEATLEVITASFTAAEGSEASFIVADETEHWTPSNGGVSLMSTLGDNLAKSGSRMLETSNAWIPGRDTVAEATYEDWLGQEEGRYASEQRILYDARMAPEDTDMADPESLTAALEFVYADCEWADIDAIKNRIWRKSSKPDDSRRKYLNRPTVSQDAWVKPEQWSTLSRSDVEVTSKEPIALFFDGSKSRDGTALVGCRIDDGHVFALGVWEPNPNDPDDEIDVNDVDYCVEQAFKQYQVAAFFADVREWESFVLTDWPRRYGDDLAVWAAPSSRPSHPIAWDMRGNAYRFAKAAEACLADIEGEAFTHGPASSSDEHLAAHAAMCRHVGNCRRRPYRDAVSVGKETRDSPRKIDAAVCVIGARMVRRLVLADPKFAKYLKRSKRRAARRIY